MRSRLPGVLLLSVTALAAPAAGRSPRPEDRALAREIYEQLVEIDTAAAAEAVAARLRAAGLPEGQVRLLGPSPRKLNVVAHLHGRSKREPPLFLLAHLDVVSALASDWSVPPFELREQDGYFTGRGTADDKAMAAIFTTWFVRFAETKAKPRRDLVLLLTAAEEGGPDNGVDWRSASSRPGSRTIASRSRRGRSTTSPRPRRSTRS